MKKQPKKLKLLIITLMVPITLLLLTLVINSCPSDVIFGYKPYSPYDGVAYHIQFTPKSGKVGDIITVTGEGFPTPEYMQTHYQTGFGSNTLVIFNYELSTDISTWYWPMIKESSSDILGTPALEAVDFDVNTIKCKVPPNAKTGRIVVSLDMPYTIYWWNNIKISSQIFTVLDASGDTVYDNSPDLLEVYSY